MTNWPFDTFNPDMDTDIMDFEQALAAADAQLAASEAALVAATRGEHAEPDTVEVKAEVVADEAAPPEPSAPAPAPAPAPNPVSGPNHYIPATPDPLLVQILSWPRTHESIGEYEFRKWLKEKITELGGKPEELTKGVGTIKVLVPCVPKAKVVTPNAFVPSTLFSCHIDTQDGRVVSPPTGTVAFKRLTYDDNFGLIALDKDSVGGCLGADDGVGVWIMLRMIEKKIPGLYLFHRGEELGGISAKAVAAHYADGLKDFDAAVAFDRPGTTEIITHQRGGTECASDKFANALAAALNAKGMDLKPSKSGVYTDVYEYRKIIAECVNLAVGYTGHHTVREELDYGHAYAMLQACLQIDWEALPIDRDPKKPDPTYSGYYGADLSLEEWRTKYGYGSVHKPPATRAPAPPAQQVLPFKPAKKGGKKKQRQPYQDVGPKLTILQEVEGLSAEDIEIMCAEQTDVAGRLIIELVVELKKTMAERDAYRALLPYHLLN